MPPRMSAGGALGGVPPNPPPGMHSRISPSRSSRAPIPFLSTQHAFSCNLPVFGWWIVGCGQGCARLQSNPSNDKAGSGWWPVTFFSFRSLLPLSFFSTSKVLATPPHWHCRRSTKTENEVDAVEGRLVFLYCFPRFILFPVFQVHVVPLTLARLPRHVRHIGYQCGGSRAAVCRS
jgi:hypothetical protein